MQVERHLQLFQRCPERLEPVLVEIQVVRSKVAVPVHHDTAEAESGDRAGQLLYCRADDLQRDSGEAAAAAGDLGGAEVVDPPRCAHRNVWVGDPFDPSNGVGQDREVDARGVHFLDPPVTQVVQPRRDHVGEFGVEAGITRSLLVVLAGKGVPVIGMDLQGICPAWSASTALS